LRDGDPVIESILMELRLPIGTMGIVYTILADGLVTVIVKTLEAVNGGTLLSNCSLERC